MTNDEYQAMAREQRRREEEAAFRRNLQEQQNGSSDSSANKRRPAAWRITRAAWARWALCQRSARR
jgi:hypothetical protein